MEKAKETTPWLPSLAVLMQVHNSSTNTVWCYTLLFNSSKLLLFFFLRSLKDGLQTILMHCRAFMSA